MNYAKIKPYLDLNLFYEGVDYIEIQYKDELKRKSYRLFERHILKKITSDPEIWFNINNSYDGYSDYIEAEFKLNPYKFLCLFSFHRRKTFFENLIDFQITLHAINKYTLERNLICY